VTADPVIATLAGLFGLVVGSFLNVCIHRLPLKLSLLHPPSRCGSCGAPVKWRDNVPVVSWLALRGRCRACGASISIVYPIVELITAVVFVLAYLQYGLSPLLGVRLLFACAMIVLFMIDLEHHLLPNVVTLPGVVVGFAASFFLPPGWFDSAVGALVGGGVLFAIAEAYYRLRHEEGMGMGDVKMLAMIGAFLGWKLAIVTLVVASFAGSIIGVGVLAIKKESMKYALPFGTFLAVGAIIAAVCGDGLIGWYFGLFQS
jgi:leader peptidase (prepilin peptidase)/N-methyltransferase